MRATGDSFIDVYNCRQDLNYLAQDVEDWRNKEFLTTAIISHLKGSPFFYPEEIILQALREEHFIGVL